MGSDISISHESDRKKTCCFLRQSYGENTSIIYYMQTSLHQAQTSKARTAQTESRNGLCLATCKPLSDPQLHQEDGLSFPRLTERETNCVLEEEKMGIKTHKRSEAALPKKPQDTCKICSRNFTYSFSTPSTH